MAGALNMYTVKLGSPEYRAALELRLMVLRTPLGLTLSAEELAVEPECQHFVATIAGNVVATLLLIPLDAETVKMRQVAVQPALQRVGIGGLLVAGAESVAERQDFRRIVAHARASAVPFYRRLGYTVEGDSFLEQTIPHRRVSKVLG